MMKSNALLLIGSIKSSPDLNFNAKKNTGTKSADADSNANTSEVLVTNGTATANTDRSAFASFASMNSLAPELVSNRAYGPKVDVWALGCIAYELASGSEPFAYEGR
jgi:serine/threonine protein kinase